MPRSSLKPSIEESDDELGIGQQDDVADLLRNPVFEKLIERAVDERIAQRMGSASTSDGGDGLRGLVQAMERMFSLQAMQTPGYVKPLSSEELESRAAGKIEMDSLLVEYERAGHAPHYILGGKFYAGDVLYDEGQEIRTYLPPAEHFIPKNEAAEKVYAAFQQYIGSPTAEIGAQVAAAMREANSPIPLVGNSAVQATKSPVEVVASAPRHDVRPKRVAGTSVPETHGVTLPQMPATAAMPSGPVFINP